MAIYTAADIWINPVRAFGPAFISNQFGGHWVAWLGPVLGAVSGALCFQFIFSEKVRKGGGGDDAKRTEDGCSKAADLAPCNGGDVEGGRPEKVALHQQLQLVVEDKQRTAVAAAFSGAGRRSRVRPTAVAGPAAAANGEAIFFDYNNAAAADPDNLSLDGTKEGRENTCGGENRRGS
jgi:hypothetical protein